MKPLLRPCSQGSRNPNWGCFDMKHITFVRPNLGEGKSTDAMTPLVFAILKARTPDDIDTVMIDERVEPFVPLPTDLVAITVETFTARRAWEIAAIYKARGVPVVVGGHHPSMVPEEALQHADAVVIGDAEGVWEQVLADAGTGKLKQQYQGGFGFDAEQPVSFDRSIFEGKKYAPVSLVQIGRGCRFACDFCSIHAFYGKRREQRPICDILDEIAGLPADRIIFFVDDNLFWRRDRFVELMHALAPLKHQWSCQITIDVARDDELLDLMEQAGCALALIGFESLSKSNLKQMHKNWNGVAGEYHEVIDKLHDRGIMIYGTFVFGYDGDEPDAFIEAGEFARTQGLAIANFNPLTPMPGTGLYQRLKDNDQLLRPHWWLDPQFKYGDAIFLPKKLSPDQLRDGPMQARNIFYSWLSIFTRAGRGVFKWRRLRNVAMMVLANIISRHEIHRKQERQLSVPQSGTGKARAEGNIA